MKRHHATLSVGLLVAATACGDILGIDDNAVGVSCFTNKDCKSPLVCREQQCVALGGGTGTSGNAATSHGGSGGLFATSGGTTSSGGSSVGPVSGGTGGVSITSGGLAGTTASDGGTTSIGGADGTVASGGTQSVGGDAGTGGSTTVVGGGGGGIASYGGTLPSTGTGGTSGATASVAGMTQGGAGGHIVTGGTAGIAAAGTGAVGNNGGVSGGSTGGVAGIAGVVGVAGVGGCAQDAHRCFASEFEGHPVYWQTCDKHGNWDTGTTCADYCSLRHNGCVVAPSCSNVNPCSDQRSCCSSIPLPSGTFDRSPVGPCANANPCRASVSGFLLDTYEVTVARYRNFVNGYPANIPTQGSGKNPNSAIDPGWLDTWNSMLPDSKAVLVQNLQSCTGATYAQDSTAGNDFKPINCLTWYLAFAFCVWDGGRLPTEAEWNYAASGGNNRFYPWSDPPESKVLSPAGHYAIYMDDVSGWDGPQAVGLAYAGIARWGQFDLAGNVSEWIADSYLETYPFPELCVDCGSYSWSENLRVLRGGSYRTDAPGLEVAYRLSATATNLKTWVGIRCARDI